MLLKSIRLLDFYGRVTAALALFCGRRIERGEREREREREYANAILRLPLPVSLVKTGFIPQ